MMKSVFTLFAFLFTLSLTAQSLSLSLLLTSPSCASANNGSVTAVGSGGIAPYTFQWSNGQTTSTITDLSSGIYFVTLTDAVSSTSVGTAFLTVLSELQIGMSTQKAECVGVATGSATATIAGNGVGPFTYLWSTGGTTATVTGLQANTTLTVTVTDTNSGCTGTATGEIEAHGQISVNVVDTDVDCAGSPIGTAVANAVSGTGPFNYVWNVNGTLVNNDTITGLGLGAYAVTVTDANGCTAASVADIGFPVNINPQFAINVLDCIGGIATIQIVNQTLGAFNWQWNIGTATGFFSSNFQNPQQFTVPYNTAINVSLNASTPAGCAGSSFQSFNVGEPPVVSISATSSGNLCESGSTAITVTGSPSYTYTWSPQTGLTILTPQTATASPTTPTTYSVIANNGGCKDTVSVNVPAATPLDVSVTNPIVTNCNPAGAFVDMSLNDSSASIVWFNAAGDSISNNLTLGVVLPPGTATYTVVVTNAQGCTDSATATVTNNAIEVNTAFLTSNNGCINQPIQAQVVSTDPTDVLTYQWSASSTNVTFSSTTVANPTITVTATGTYTVSVTLTNQHNCTRVLTTQLTINQTDPGLAYMSDWVCGQGWQITIINPLNLSGVWDFGDGSPTSTELAPVHIYDEVGNYNLTFEPSDSACFQTFTNQFNLPLLPFLEAAIQAPATYPCIGLANVTFTDASQVSGPITSWNWTFQPGGQTSNEQNPTITFNQATDVIATLIVADDWGCFDTTQVVLEVDIVNDTLPAATTLCAGSTVSLNPLNNPNYTYNWTSVPPDPNLVANSPNPIVSPTVPTVYSVAIQDGTCIVNQSVSVNPSAAAVVAASADIQSCVAQMATISATTTAGSMFEWSNNPNFTNVFATTASANVMPTTPASMNYVRVTAPNGCIGIDSVLVGLATVQVMAEPANQTLCNESEAQLTVMNLLPTDTLTYSWSAGLPSVANPVATVGQSSIFTAVVTNQYGCTATLNFNVNVVNLSASVEAPDTICEGQSAILNTTVTGGTVYMFDWSPAGTLSDPAVSNPIASPTSNTDYTLVVTDASGCTLELSTPLAVMATACAEPYLFVPNAFTPNNDDNNDFFRIRSINATEVYLAVWDRWGEKVYETEDINHKGWDGTFRNVQLSPDAYAWYARVRCGDGQFWEKKGNVTLLR
jgi:gliding motility-associated-like protein